MSALHWIVLSLRSVPSLDIFVTLSEGDVTESEPKKESADGESMLGWDQEGVNDEETS